MGLTATQRRLTRPTGSRVLAAAQAAHRSCETVAQAPAPWTAGGSQGRLRCTREKEGVRKERAN